LLQKSQVLGLIDLQLKASAKVIYNPDGLYERPRLNHHGHLRTEAFLNFAPKNNVDFRAALFQGDDMGRPFFPGSAISGNPSGYPNRLRSHALGNLPDPIRAISRDCLLFPHW
jgi:hypothetical protein